MPLDRDFAEDLKNFKPITMEFKIKNRVLKDEEKEKLIAMLDEEIKNAKQMKRVFTVVEKALGALAKGALIAI